MTVLRFPSEPRKYRDLRNWARQQFQLEIRAPALRRFGAETGDLGVLIVACRRCGQPTSSLHTFPGLSGMLSQGELETTLRRLWGTERHGWRSAFCASCQARDEHIYPVVAHFARYLPESKRDLQLELVFGDERVLRIDYHRMNPDGTSVAVARPVDEVATLEVFGAPLSMQRLWHDFITRHMNAGEMVTRAVQTGYILGLRPFTEDPAVAMRCYAGFERWIEQKRRERPFDTITFLRDREEDDIPIPEADSYHAWLPAFAQDVSEALLDPFIVADSDAFVAVLAEVAQSRGVGVERDSGEETLYARLTCGEVSVRLNLGPRYFKILHTGRTFHRGVIELFATEILALQAAGRLPRQLRDALPDHQVEVVEGTRLVVRGLDGATVFADDVVRVATDQNTRDARVLEALAARIRAGAVAARA